MGSSALRAFIVASLALSLVVYSSKGMAQAPPATTANDAGWVIPSNERIRSLLAQRTGTNGIGIVVGVIEPGGRRIVTYGKSGAKDARPLDGDTVFQIGSLTKVFTGLLLADMVQRGEVGIEDPVAKYLPANVSMPQRGRAITLIDLSKHWSGLPSMPTNFSLTARPNPYSAYTVEQWYAFLSSYPLPREPGRQAYSNLGVALLGHVLARHAGMEYAALLQQRVLAPLGLEDTSIVLNPEQQQRLAPGHDRFLEPVETWEMVVMPASGSLRSTANDMLEFLAYHLGTKETALHPAMVYMRTPMRALGWGRSTLGGESVYGHEGGKEGYRSAVLFNPRTKTGVVVLMNARTDEQAYALVRHLLFPASPLSAAPVAPLRPRRMDLAARLLESYAGTYRSASGAHVKVARRDDRLLLDTEGGGIYTLFAANAQTFFATTDDVHVTFTVDARGQATALELREASATTNAVKVGSP